MTDGREFKTSKIGGKTEYSGRRRSSSRKSGYSSHADATGGHLQRVVSQWVEAGPDDSLVLNVSLPADKAERPIVGFGFYFNCPEQLEIITDCGVEPERLVSDYGSESWSKIGWVWQDGKAHDFHIIMTPHARTEIGIFRLAGGISRHDFFTECDPKHLKNLHLYAPEALFNEVPDGITLNKIPKDGYKKLVWLKECNRCARFLPINEIDERATLSFSNHCVSRRPCKHSGFGRIEDIETNEEFQFEYGFQLECRVCKKFAVNAALNPQRTADQMKEDGQRRRAFEHLIAELDKNSKSLSFRQLTGSELTTFIWEKFGRACFNCGKPILKRKDMHLDHTRPLAMLWPLDETATCLCAACNSSKRDRFPADFYDQEQLTRLSEMTGIALSDLSNPGPNIRVLNDLIAREEWFYTKFLTDPKLLREKEGKRAAELICKALDRTLKFVEDEFDQYSFVERYHHYMSLL